MGFRVGVPELGSFGLKSWLRLKGGRLGVGVGVEFEGDEEGEGGDGLDAPTGLGTGTDEAVEVEGEREVVGLGAEAVEPLIKLLFTVLAGIGFKFVLGLATVLSPELARELAGETTRLFLGVGLKTIEVVGVGLATSMGKPASSAAYRIELSLVMG